jgi:hypothetical protein
LWNAVHLTNWDAFHEVFLLCVFHQPRRALQTSRTNTATAATTENSTTRFKAPTSQINNHSKLRGALHRGTIQPSTSVYIINSHDHVIELSEKSRGLGLDSGGEEVDVFEGSKREKTGSGYFGLETGQVCALEEPLTRQIRSFNRVRID